MQKWEMAQVSGEDVDIKALAEAGGALHKEGFFSDTRILVRLQFLLHFFSHIKVFHALQGSVSN